MERITTEIARLKTRIADDQSRLRELERKRLEIENTEILGVIRGIDMTHEELLTYLKSCKSQRSKTVPDEQGDENDA